MPALRVQIPQVVSEALSRRLKDAREPAEILGIVAEDAYRFTLANCTQCLQRLADRAKTEALQQVKGDKRWRKLLGRLRDLFNEDGEADPHLPMLGLTQLSNYLTLKGSFSAVSKPTFARKYALESSRRDLHNAVLCTAL